MKVSVCMATYNGARYVREQVASILDQLGADDELVISDDGSSDGTLARVQAIPDRRIVFVANASRLGYVRNFERALSLARGDLIFLSDQDDVWVPGKLARIKEVFMHDPQLAMVHHERELIDAEGASLGPGPVLGEGVRAGWGFALREGVKATVWGCALAMRRQALDLMLPFPTSVYAHDHWAIAIGALAGGIQFLPERLIRHRLHGANVTPKHGLPFGRRVLVRLKYLSMLREAAVRVRRQRDRS